MDCSLVREAVSARLDGEDVGVDLAALHRHLGTCGPCRSFERGAVTLARSTRVAPADDVPDLTAPIMAAMRPSRPVGPLAEARVALALTGVVQLILSVADLAGAGHTARELGAFEVALAVGFLLAAWRPATAAGLVPVMVLSALAVNAAAIGDVVTGGSAAGGELVHLGVATGAMFTWLVARWSPPERAVTA